MVIGGKPRTSEPCLIAALVQTSVPVLAAQSRLGRPVEHMFCARRTARQAPQPTVRRDCCLACAIYIRVLGYLCPGRGYGGEKRWHKRRQLACACSRARTHAHAQHARTHTRKRARPVSVLLQVAKILLPTALEQPNGHMLNVASAAAAAAAAEADGAQTDGTPAAAAAAAAEADGAQTGGAQPAAVFILTEIKK